MNQPTPNLQPTILVIFGITGDLAQRKLLPALYHLFKDNLLHEHTQIIGLSRREMPLDAILDQVKLCVLETDNTCDPETLARFRRALRLVRLDPVVSDDYQELHRTLDAIETEHGLCMNRLFYLAIPPQVYGPVVRNLGEHHLQNGCQHGTAASRLLVEKPFGYDLTSAEELITETSRYFSEEQVFRIDHYLAKETAQNILTFRQHNAIFSSLWNDRHISDIDIIATEKIGVEGRGSFYDNVGALRDLVQSHLLQLLTLITADLPKNIHNADELHGAKQALLRAVRPVDPLHDRVVRGQYEGYPAEVQNATSKTETYVSLDVRIETPRWQYTTVRITTGKALQAKQTAIILSFGTDGDEEPNQLTFRLQPNEGIDVELLAKRPGFDDKMQVVKMDFSYHGVFGDDLHPDAYERVLVDAVKGDRSLFATSEEVLASWRILQPILNAWQQDDSDLRPYSSGSEGPTA